MTSVILSLTLKIREKISPLYILYNYSLNAGKWSLVSFYVVSIYMYGKSFIFYFFLVIALRGKNKRNFCDMLLFLNITSIN